MLPEHAIPPLNPAWLPRAATLMCPSGRTNGHGRDHKQPGTLAGRVAVLDIEKAPVTACVRVRMRDKPGVRRREVGPGS